MSVTLKVRFLDGTVRSMRFNPESTIIECIKTIAEKVGTDNYSAKKVGLFQEATSASPSRWLRADRTLIFYDIKDGQSNKKDVVIIKNKVAPAKVELVDGTVKTIMIDASTPVVEVVEVIGHKLALKNSEEYSLQVSDTVSDPLDQSKSLWDNGVTENEKLILKVSEAL